EFRLCAVLVPLAKELGHPIGGTAICFTGRRLGLEGQLGLEHSTGLLILTFGAKRDQKLGASGTKARERNTVAVRRTTDETQNLTHAYRTLKQLTAYGTTCTHPIRPICATQFESKLLSFYSRFESCAVALLEFPFVVFSLVIASIHLPRWL